MQPNVVQDGTLFYWVGYQYPVAIHLVHFVFFVPLAFMLGMLYERRRQRKEAGHTPEDATGPVRVR